MTGDGTATAGSDYTATNGTLVFAAGQTSKQIDVSVGPYWRQALTNAPRLNYQSRPYNLADAWFLPGQGLYDRFSPAARHTFADRANQHKNESRYSRCFVA